MELAVLLATLTMFWNCPVSAKVRCYQCDPDFLMTGVKTKLCQYFDGSEKYMTDCLNSTMCYKKSVTMEFGNKVTTGITRGCASQTLRDEQEKTNGKWSYTHRIHEVYEEKCSDDPNIYQKPTSTRHCYCRGDLCNAASHKQLTFAFVLLSSILCLVLQFINGFS